MSYRAPEPLGPAHLLDEFECGSAEQTEWLKRFARQSASMVTRVFVVTETDVHPVVAYYAWCMARPAIGDAPERSRKVPDGIHNPLRCSPGSAWITRTKARVSALGS